MSASALPFPTSPDALSAGWLSKTLGFDVKGFEVEYFSEGAGVIGFVTRVHLDSSDGPDSVIAKFPTPAPENLAVAKTYDMYGREVRFYEGVSNAVNVRTPACYHVEFDAETYNFVLLLEDLTDYRIGDQVAGCTLNEARAVVDAIAGLHASGWIADQAGNMPKAFEGVISHNNPMQRDGMVAGFQMGWPVCVERFPELIPAAAREAARKMPDRVGPLLAEMCVDPVCLSHTDVRLDNIFFGDGEIALIDWQAVCTTAPEQDLAYFITQSVPPAVREQEDLVGRYHSALTGLGIDYSPERLRHRYRISALYLLCFAVVIAGTLDMGNERGRLLARTLLGNSLSALDAMEAFALL